jgi:hypothetical protein
LRSATAATRGRSHPLRGRPGALDEGPTKWDRPAEGMPTTLNEAQHSASESHPHVVGPLFLPARSSACCSGLHLSSIQQYMIVRWIRRRQPLADARIPFGAPACCSGCYSLSSLSVEVNVQVRVMVRMSVSLVMLGGRGEYGAASLTMRIAAASRIR